MTCLLRAAGGWRHYSRRVVLCACPGAAAASVRAWRSWLPGTGEPDGEAPWPAVAARDLGGRAQRTAASVGPRWPCRVAWRGRRSAYRAGAYRCIPQEGLQYALSPLATDRLLGVPAGAVAGRVVDLADIVGVAAGQLVDDIASTDDSEPAPRRPSRKIEGTHKGVAESASTGTKEL